MLGGPGKGLWGIAISPDGRRLAPNIKLMDVSSAFDHRRLRAMPAEPTPASANAGSSAAQGTSTGQGTSTTSSSQSQERMYLVPAALARPDQDGSTMLTLHLRFSPILDLGASRVQVFVISKHGIIACHPRLTPLDLRTGRCSLRLKISELAGLVPGLLHVLVLQHLLNPQQCLVSAGHAQIPGPEAHASRDAQTVLLAALPVLVLPPKVAAEVQRHFTDMVREVQEGTYYFLDQPDFPGSMGDSAASLAALNQIDAPARPLQSNSLEEGLSQDSSRASQRREAVLDELETWLSPNLASHLQQWRAASGSRETSDVSGDPGSSSVSVAQHEGAPRSVSVPANISEETFRHHPDSANVQDQHRMAMSEAGGSGLSEPSRPPALYIPPASPASMEEGDESLSPTAAWVSATSSGLAAPPGPAPPARPPSSQNLQHPGSSSAAAEQTSSPSATTTQAVEVASAQAAASSQASSDHQQSAAEPSSLPADEADQSTSPANAPFGHSPLRFDMQMLDSLLPSSLSAHAIHGAAARLLGQPDQPGGIHQTPQGVQPAASAMLARAALPRHLPVRRFRPAEAFVSHLHLAPFAHHLDTLRAAAEQATAEGHRPGHTLQVSAGTGPSGPSEPVCSEADRQPASTSSSRGKAELQIDLDAILAAVCGFASPRKGQAGSGAEPPPVAPSSLFGNVMASVGDSGALRLRVPDAPTGLADVVISDWREANQSPDAASQAASVALTPALLRFLLQNRLINCFELVGGWVHDAGQLSLVCGGHIVDPAEAAAYVKGQLARYERPVLTVQGARNIVQPLGFLAEEEEEEEGSQEGQGGGDSEGDEEDELEEVAAGVWEPHARNPVTDDQRRLTHAAEAQAAVLQSPAQESLPPAAMPAADTMQLPRCNSGGAAASGLLPAALTGAQLVWLALVWTAQAFVRGAASLWRIVSVPDAAGGSVLQTDARVLLARLAMSVFVVLTSSLPGSSKEHWPLQGSKVPRGSPVLAVAKWVLLREPPVLLLMAFRPSAYMMYRPLMISGVLSVGVMQINELLGEAAWELRDPQFPLIALAVVYFIIEALVTPLVLTMQQQLALLVIATQVAPVALLPLRKLIQPPLAFGPALEADLPVSEGDRQREELTVPLTVVLGLGLVQLLLICFREHKSLWLGRKAA